MTTPTPPDPGDIARIREELRKEVGEPTGKDGWRPQITAGEVQALLAALDAADARGDGLAADLGVAVRRCTQYESQEVARQVAGTTIGPLLTTSWRHLDDERWYAEIGIDPDAQRLVAHAENADRAQLVADLRALAYGADRLAYEIETVVAMQPTPAAN